MFEDFKPGQRIKCTITSVPRAEDRSQTIKRLMRRDPKISKGLRAAQRHRRKTMVVYTRGNRDWFKRRKASRLAHVVPGNTWEMALTPDLIPDLRSIEKYISVENA